MEQVGIWDRSLQLLFEITSDAMLLVDLPRNHCVALNPVAVRLLGQPLPELLAQTLDTLLPGLPATIWPAQVLLQSDVEASAEANPVAESSADWVEFALNLGDLEQRVRGRAIAHFIPDHHLLVLQPLEAIHAVSTPEAVHPPSEDGDPERSPAILDDPHLTDLYHSERLFRSVFHQTFQLASLLTPAGIVIQDNQTALDFCQTPAGASQGRLFFELPCWLHSTQAAQRQLRDAIAQAAQGHTLRYETEICGSQGTLIPIDFSIKPLRDEAGQVELLIAEGRDLSERKQMEDSLRQSEAKFAATFEANPNPIALTRLSDGQFLDVNESFCRITGYTKAEVIGRTGLDLELWPFPDAWDTLLASLQTSGTLWNYEALFCMKSGEVRVGLISCQVLDLAGEACILGVIKDITERKRTEEAFRASDQRQRALLNAIPDLLLHVQQDGTCLSCRLPSGEDDHRFLPIVNHISEVLPPDLLAQELQVIERVLATGEPDIHEHRLHKYGQWLDEEVRVVPMDADTVLIMVRDVTERKQAEASLRRQAEEERVLGMIIQHIRQSLDIDDILNTAIREIRRLLQAERVVIFRTGNRTDHGPAMGLTATPASLPPASHGEAAADRTQDAAMATFTDRPEDYLASEDLARDSEGIRGAEPWEMESMMLPGAMHHAPIIQPTPDGAMRVWGLLIVHWQRRPPHLVLTETKHFLQRIAVQLAIAIQQAELYQQLRTLNTNLETQVQERTQQLQRSLDAEALLKEITRRLRDSLDETRILEAAMQELATNLAIQFGNIALYHFPLSLDAEPNLALPTDLPADYPDLTIAAEYRMSDPTEPLPQLSGVVLPFNDYALFYRQLRDNVPFQMTVPVGTEPQQWMTVLLCPIADETNTLLGDLLLIRRCEQYFDEMELGLVQQVALQCAIAIRQARLYEAAQAQVTELARLNRLKDDFLDTISHELRTPMATLKMATEMLEVRLQQAEILGQATPTEIDRYFTILKTACAQETTLINNLLDLTRLDADTDPLMLMDVGLRAWVEHIAEVFDRHLQQHQQQLQIAIPPTLTLHTDLTYLERIVTELLTNACKYTPAGGTIRITAASLPGRVQMRVCNPGSDLPAEECDRMFDQFYRIPSNDPWKHQGTGLGLALVKKLTAKLGGTIHAECGDQQICIIINFLTSSTLSHRSPPS